MYRITITDAAATDREQIDLSCSIEQSDDGATWIPLAGAPTTLSLSLSAVIGALRAAGGDAEKRAALTELIRTEARSLPALQGAVAVKALEGLIPGGWPAIVAL